MELPHNSYQCPRPPPTGGAPGRRLLGLRGRGSRVKARGSAGEWRRVAGGAGLRRKM